MKSLPGVIAACSATLLITSCGGTSSPSGTSSGMPDGPKETVGLYMANCISCHGTDLQGRMGPETDIHAIGGKWSKEQIAAQIANGGGLMPAFKERLTEEQIGALADWLAAHK
ncbi:c-type cytochrome [Paenibacillus beijingensis]|uniref:Cytochrome c domain-containing protein n=1 Tax=Paenibacillus beijingensis TaxID=1126833 RepID=A0A0D5NFG3_9BACL|nr:cytochrome c [Paenibacillus beijingensis]AJY74006.1 hypothetical protein VN24_04510 [Paenibacillus beijingensis]